MLGIVWRFSDGGPMVGNEVTSGLLDFGTHLDHLGSMYPYFVWVVGSISHDFPVFYGFPSRHFISHSAERGQWNQIDPLDQDVVSGMVGEEATRNFMVGFGKSMNFKSKFNPCHLLTQRHLNFRDVHSRKLTWQWRLQRRMNHLQGVFPLGKWWPFCCYGSLSCGRWYW